MSGNKHWKWECKLKPHLIHYDRGDWKSRDMEYSHAGNNCSLIRVKSLLSVN